MHECLVLFFKQSQEQDLLPVAPNIIFTTESQTQFLSKAQKRLLNIVLSCRYEAAVNTDCELVM